MNNRERIWEVDFLRGIAILLMVVFHLIFDLNEYLSYPLSYSDGFWYYIGKAAASLFILLCGISAHLSGRTLRHGLIVFLWGMLLTVVTYIYVPALYIRFGVLHLLGLSLLSYPFIRSWPPALALLLAIGVMAAGPTIAVTKAATDWLLPVGVTSPAFASLDFYPLIPWYGLFLLGSLLGRLAYPQKATLLPAVKCCSWLIVLGRHSLLIYLVHQPLLLVVLLLLRRLALL